MTWRVGGREEKLRRREERGLDMDSRSTRGGGGRKAFSKPLKAVFSKRESNIASSG